MSAALAEIRKQAEDLKIEARLSRHSDRRFHAEAAAERLTAALGRLESLLLEKHLS